MLVVGLTGGIGSGKSTVAKLFEERGITVVDTDQLARELTLPGKPALNEIVAKLGEEILLNDKTLDRAQLRKRIFLDSSLRSWLEGLLHPLIRAETKRLLDMAQSRYSIVVIPLLFEAKSNPLINRILVVDALEEQQVQRAKLRDRLSEKEIQAIMNTQVTRQQRLEKADDVILNDGMLEHLIPQVEKLHLFYLQLSGKE